MFIKTELTKQLVDYDTYLDGERFLSQVDFGSTYQDTGDEDSDIDYVLVYLNKFEEFLIDNTKVRNKQYGELDTRLVPLVRLVDLFTKPSYDSLLILNRLMEEESEFSRYMFSYLAEKDNYVKYLSMNEKTLGMSIVGNIHSATKRYTLSRLSGKTLVKLITFISVYERYTTLIDSSEGYLKENYTTVSKIKEEYKDVIKLKRETHEELKENIVLVSKLHFFKTRNYKITKLEDVIEFFKEYEEEIKLRVETKKDSEDKQYEYKELMYDKVVKIYKKYI